MPLSSLFNGPNFLLPSHPLQNKRTSTRSGSDAQSSSSIFLPSSESSDLWHEKYTPTQEDELAVRKQKLDEVKHYINKSAVAPLPGHYRLLVLSGPTGVGKSTSIKILAKSMGYDILEWKNGQQQRFDQGGHFDSDYEPTMDKFAQFLHRAIHTATTLNTRHERTRKIILLDDMPDLTTYHVKRTFQSLLQSYIESNHAFLIVITHSEAQMDAGFGRQHRYSSKETQLTNLNDIVTKDIRLSGRCGIVEFNPIIKSKLKLVLSRILKSEAMATGRPPISSQHLDDIIESCHGDIRCAILTMQFCAAREPLLRGKRKLDSDPHDKSRIRGRVNHLEFFHAIGKVLYAKRTPSGTLESKPAKILNNLNTDSERYLGVLFSNYSKMMKDIDDISRTMNYICDGDMISGMGAWNDDVPLEYQLLISMHAIMATERQPSAFSGKPDFNSDGYFYKQRESPKVVTPIVTACQVSNEASDDVTEAIENEDIDDDNCIGSFSDDEFDDIYGDGADLSFMDSIP